MSTIDPHWYQPGKFFGGNFYPAGDDSAEGFQMSPKTLEQRTQEEVEGIFRLLRLRLDDRILDLPCGYGRHSLGLAERGYRRVTGADLNTDHLLIMKDIREQKGLECRLNVVDMLTMDYRRQFEAAINMFFSFGFFPTDEENEQVARNFRHALVRGGRFLMHTDVNLSRIASGQYRLHEIRNLMEGGKLIIDERYDVATKRIEGSWRVERKVGTEEREYSVRVYSFEEFKDLSKKVGFKNIRAYGDWQGGKYSSDSEQMIVVAEAT